MPPSRSQSITSGLTRASIFLVLTVSEDAGAEPAVRGLCAELSSLVRGIGFRSTDGALSCVMGIGASVWERLFGSPRPKDLHAFREINGVHHAPATAGDLLFHIRANQLDLCFELATQIAERLANAAKIIDEVHGFKYFDARDLLGFVDGTENPTAQAALEATTIGDEDAAYAGGSYVIIQKYLHDLEKWNAIPVERQEAIIGRKKLSDIELAEAQKPSYAHNVLTNISEDGKQLQILRDNMPFGTVGKGEFGTYFIGYARSPRRIEMMLENMFVGKPPGNYDRVLDVSKAVTGCLFFVPTTAFLEAANNDQVDKDEDQNLANIKSKQAGADASLRIGSLKNGNES